jgi:redox-sensing transcriptional repressor
MALGYSGTPNNGYEVSALIDHITRRLYAEEGQRAALVGVGNLGRALLSYFGGGQRTRISLAAAFDVRPEKTGRVIAGCPCYPVEEMIDVVRREGISVGIVAVPVEAAQEAADGLVEAGVMGILNFAPTPVRAPRHVFVEDVDITIKLETVAFFARRKER